MKLAMKDLEIRGAGDILGVQQSGQVSTVGFHLYCKLLKKAVDAFKKNIQASFLETKMEFSYYACIPEFYIEETSLRLEIYHKLGEALEVEVVDELFKELEDRFGKPPTPLIWLYHMTKIRIFANKHSFVLVKFEKFTFFCSKTRKR